MHQGAQQYEDGGGVNASGLNKNWKKREYHKDLDKRAVVHTDAMEWDPSPEYPDIGRKFLDRNGAGTFTPSTTIVSFGTGVADEYRTHPHGEEYFVISGVFSDHTGDYLPGFYVRHPINWCHAPFVRHVNQDNTRAEPAVLWVKVSQQVNEGEEILVKDTESPDEEWTVDPRTGKGEIKRLLLFKDANEHVFRETWAPGSEISVHQPRDGEEIFIIEGDMINERMSPDGAWVDEEKFTRRTWVRNPDHMVNTIWRRRTKNGCSILYKHGHLKNLKTIWGKEVSSDATVLPQDKRIHGNIHYVDKARVKRQKEDGSYANIPKDKIFNREEDAVDRLANDLRKGINLAGKVASRAEQVASKGRNVIEKGAKNLLGVAGTIIRKAS